jgi:hypothetical protein
MSHWTLPKALVSPFKRPTSEIKFSGLVCSLCVIFTRIRSFYNCCLRNPLHQLLFSPLPLIQSLQIQLCLCCQHSSCETCRQKCRTLICCLGHGLSLFMFFTEHHLSLFFGSYCSSSSKNIRETKSSIIQFLSSNNKLAGDLTPVSHWEGNYHKHEYVWLSDIQLSVYISFCHLCMLNLSLLSVIYHLSIIIISSSIYLPIYLSVIYLYYLPVYLGC